jgi:histidinol-phosphate phosphatase family protein
MLDRDGTIIKDKAYLSDPAAVELEQGAVEGLRRLIDHGALPVVITNQSGVARGYFPLDSVDAVHRKLDDMLSPYGVAPAAYYVCPHGPDDRCECRKPASELAIRAAHDFSLDLDTGFVIGDKLSDTGLAAAVGATGILVCTGEGSAHADEARRRGFAVARDLNEAADLVIAARARQAG